jgi:Flp pilus assembly CpaF family ATPase
VEETPEIRLVHEHQIRLASSSELGIDMHSLIMDSLRMRPDRIIVGETRTAAETKAFVDTLLAGQGKGSYATFHAQSSSEALVRMQSMGIPSMDLSSIDLVLVQKRWSKVNEQGFRSEERKIIELCEWQWNENRLESRVLTEYDYRNDSWRHPFSSQKVAGKIQRTFGFTEKELLLEIQERKRFLEEQPKEIEMNEFFRLVNTE